MKGEIDVKGAVGSGGSGERKTCAQIESVMEDSSCSIIVGYADIIGGEEATSDWYSFRWIEHNTHTSDLLLLFSCINL